MIIEIMEMEITTNLDSREENISKELKTETEEEVGILISR